VISRCLLCVEAQWPTVSPGTSQWDLSGLWADNYICGLGSAPESPPTVEVNVVDAICCSFFASAAVPGGG
jgi:hypothetical protein